MNSFHAILFLTVMLGLSACQSPSNSPSQPTSSEKSYGGYRWELVEINGQAVTPSPNQETPHLLFFEAEGRIAGSTGCNRLMGSYQILGDGSLKLGNVATTMMACPDMSTEAALLEALRSFETSSREANVLLLVGPDSQALARFVAKPFTE